MSIKSWPLTILFCILFSFFLWLSYWQWQRAHQKTALLQLYHERMSAAPLQTLAQKKPTDLRFQRLQLVGYFDTAHSFLLDNKTYKHRVGYELYTPFIASTLAQPLLVDRGFIPLSAARTHLPTLKAIPGLLSITGLLNAPPHLPAWGKLTDTPPHRWPKRIQYLQLAELSALYGKSFTPIILILDPKHPAAYPLEWQIVIMPPEKHRAYALQWFALAITLLILFVALNRRKGKSF